MIKRFVVTLCVLCAIAAGASAQNAGDFETKVENGAVTITKYTGSAKELAIPATISGLPVTEIGYSAFDDCRSLTNVTIPSSVTAIGMNAFRGCISLASVTIPSSVTAIELGAFAYCSSLTSVTIPSSVTTIEEHAFYGCSSLTSVTIPSSVTELGLGAFSDCNLDAATRSEITRRFGNAPL